MLPRGLGPAPHGRGRTAGRWRGTRAQRVLPCPGCHRCWLHWLRRYSPRRRGGPEGTTPEWPLRWRGGGGGGASRPGTVAPPPNLVKGHRQKGDCTSAREGGSGGDRDPTQPPAVSEGTLSCRSLWRATAGEWVAGAARRVSSHWPMRCGVVRAGRVRGPGGGVKMWTNSGRCSPSASAAETSSRPNIAVQDPPRRTRLHFDLLLH